MSSMEFNRTHPLPSVIKVPKVGLNIHSQNVSIKLGFPEKDAPTILKKGECITFQLFFWWLLGHCFAVKSSLEIGVLWRDESLGQSFYQSFA
jgi:hypothetical protein